MTIQECFGSVTLDGIKEISNTFNHLNNAIMIGDVKKYLKQRKTILEKEREDELSKFNNFIGKYFIIKYVKTMVNAQDLTIMCHITNYNDGEQKFVCDILKKYGNSYEFCYSNNMSTYDLKTNALQTVTEIDEDKYLSILNAYQRLQSIF